MRYIEDSLINKVLKGVDCVEWVTDSFKMKYNTQLPAKISVHPAGNDFFTTMPCLLPEAYHRFGVKVVSRIDGRVPSLRSELLLFDSRSGEIIALMDADRITAMRTGAVATLAIKTFRKSKTVKYAFIGLGNTARATMICMLHEFKNEELEIFLLRYKKQAEIFCKRFEGYENVHFTIVDDISSLINNADVLVSCITDADGLLEPDDNIFSKGILLVPVHTRGFQNCDLFFDKVFADDTAHVKGFKYFSRFKSFNEISNVLLGNCKGRENDDERIISYNIGLALHDVLFASRIYDMIPEEFGQLIDIKYMTDKFWL
jgi:ornithine cyclodeaminase